MLDDDSLVVEEKLDGTNVGIHFSAGELVLQCRGHEITAGMHPQYDLFKQWVTTKTSVFQSMLADRFIIYGEWLYAKHSIYYSQLPHYFFEFDVFDKQDRVFLDLERRLAMLDGNGISTVPVVHRGTAALDELLSLIGPSKFSSQFDNSLTGKTDNLMEGVYLRTESDGQVTGRAKFVRPAFVEKIKQSSHWQHQKMIPNQLAQAADIWS